MKQLSPLDPPTVRALLARLGLDREGGAIEIDLDEQHSNSLARVRFPTGRMLVIKRARYAALAERFDTSAEASRLLHERTDLLAPHYLELPDSPGEPPLLVYWWIPNPTLEHVWSDLDPRERTRALSECGRLLRRIHTVHLAGHGPLVDNDWRGRPLRGFLEEDLLERLLPAVEGCWPEQTPGVERLQESFVAAMDERGPREAVLVHNDLFTANVLCDRAGAEFHCVGVIDFEDSFAGPPEADLARTEVLHGPLFGRALDRDWFGPVLDGYDGELDGPLLCLFRAYHLLNMGYHAAAIGLAAHAVEVGRAVEHELDRWTEGARHTAVVA